MQRLEALEVRTLHGWMVTWLVYQILVDCWLQSMNEKLVNPSDSRSLVRSSATCHDEQCTTIKCVSRYPGSLHIRLKVLQWGFPEDHTEGLVITGVTMDIDGNKFGNMYPHIILTFTGLSHCQLVTMSCHVCYLDL